jgi:predicted aldo/keto reductase-like oxidoreductase
MKYRQLGVGDFDISILSAGLLQLDFIAGELEQSRFDEQLDAVRHAVAGGVNAINLGFPFFIDDPGVFTRRIRAFLKEDGVRNRVKFFVNLPVTGNPTLDDFERRLTRLHEWFGIDRFDYCLIEDIERFGWARFVRLGALDWALKKIEEGRIEKLGFDFRDDCFFLKNIFDAYSWNVAQFRYSFMDSNLHPGFSGIKYVKDAGAGLVATDPFKTRRLLAGIPDEAQQLLDCALEKRSVDEWSLLCIWSRPEISSVFTSFTDVNEAKRFLEYANRQEPIDISAEIMISRVTDVYRKKRIFGCTECRCCMPCPIGIDSPGIAALYNDYLMYGNDNVPRFLYGARGYGKIMCEGCEICTKHCPKRYKLMDAVLQSQSLFGGAGK